MCAKCVVTVDIKGSMSVSGERRKRLQRSLFNVTERLKKFSDDLFAVGMTGGDEFQAVLLSPKKAMDVFKLVQNHLAVDFYFGVGVGSVEAVGKKFSPSEMYGSAFYSSRDAINEAKKRHVQLVFRTGNENLDFQLNTIAELLLFIRGGWTRRQREILNFMESHEETVQKRVAEHFGVSEQAVSKVVRVSGFELVRQAEKLVRVLLAVLENSKPLKVYARKSTSEG
jgi:hypothetical protein